jgi:hypothetical protein
MEDGTVKIKYINKKKAVNRKNKIRNKRAGR